MSRSTRAASLKKRKIRTTVRRVVSSVISVILVFLILAVAYLSYCSLSGKIAFFGGRALIKIVSPSMEPTIPTGEYILVERVDPNDVQVGDVIVFLSRDPSIYGKMNTHRVVAITAGDNGVRFVTRGDNNSANDPLTTLPDDLCARYVKNLDRVSDFAAVFTKKWVFFPVVIIPSLILVVLSVVDLVRRSREVKMDFLVEAEVKRLKKEGLDKNPSDSSDQTEKEE